MTSDMPMPGYGPGDIHPSTPYAFLRAALAEDHDALVNLMNTNDVRSLALQIAALAATLGEEAHGSLQELDAYLQRCQQAAAQIEVDDTSAEDSK